MRPKKVILPVIVAGVISVGIFGAKAAWAIGNSESRLYKVESVRDNSTGKTAGPLLCASRLHGKWRCDMVWSMAECCCTCTDLSDSNKPR